MEVSDLLHVPAILSPGKKMLVVSIGLEVWHASEPVWNLVARRKFPAHDGNQTLLVHPIV